MRQHFPVITRKVLVSVILAGFILCSLIFTAGYWAFSRQFRTQYDSNIRAIAAAATECLYPDDFDSYLAKNEGDEKYETTQKILQDFVDKFDLNLLYVSQVKGPDYQHITYIHNPVKKGGKWTEFPLGYEENYIEPNYNSSAKRVLENGETIVRHTLKTRSGSHITAMLPVKNSSGKIVAVLGAQKNIQEFVNARYFYINFVVIVEIFFAIAFVILFSLYFNQSIIKPIFQITTEANHFASFGGEPSQHLLEIKKHDEIGILSHTIYQMESDVCRNIKELTQITAEKERYATELNVATKIQSEALPQGYPPFPNRTDFDLYATMTPAKEVGGDLYDYLLLDEDHLMIIVGDVSGKGVPAALFMMTAKTLIDSYAEHGLSPKEIFDKTNNQLCKGNESGLFVTCWLGIFTFSTGELKYVNAGHPFPVIFHEDNFSYLTEKPNLMLGAMDFVSYTEHSIILNKNDSIFVYTDGVTEANSTVKELYGEDRLLETMKTTQNMTAPQTLDIIKKSVNDFVGEAEQFDDITMLHFIWRG